MTAATATEPRAPLRPTRARAAVLASVATGALCLLFAEPSAVGVVGAVAVALVVWLAAIDLEFRLIPNRVVLPATLAVLGLVAVLAPALADERVVAALGAGALLYIAAAVHSTGLGMGDVKLSVLLGAILGSSVIVALFVGFVAAAVVGVALVVRSGPSALKQQLPLAPFLALGTVVALIAAPPA